MWLRIVEGVVMLVVAVKVTMFGAKQHLHMVIDGENPVNVMCEQCREMPTWGIVRTRWSCVQILSRLCGVSQV